MVQANRHVDTRVRGGFNFHMSVPVLSSDQTNEVVTVFPFSVHVGVGDSGGVPNPEREGHL